MIVTVNRVVVKSLCVWELEDKVLLSSIFVCEHFRVYWEFELIYVCECCCNPYHWMRFFGLPLLVDVGIHFTKACSIPCLALLAFYCFACFSQQQTSILNMSWYFVFSNAFVFGKDGIIKALAIKNMSPLVRVTYFLQIALITFK